MKYPEDYSEFPSVEELWAKLNDHRPQMVKANEFFISPKRMLEMMQKYFTEN